MCIDYHNHSKMKDKSILRCRWKMCSDEKDEGHETRGSIKT